MRPRRAQDVRSCALQTAVRARWDAQARRHFYHFYLAFEQAPKLAVCWKALRAPGRESYRLCICMPSPTKSAEIFPAAERERLKALLRKHSVYEGDFLLASGKRSNLYVDARLTTLRADAMPLIGKAFLAKMRERGWKPAAVGGLTMGADPVVAAIAHESTRFGEPVHGFLVRKAAKGHGRQRRIEGLKETAGQAVVIVDDVCTTGGSTIQAIEAAREATLNVLGALCLVDREEGAREAIEQRNQCPFDSIFRMPELLERS